MKTIICPFCNKEIHIESQNKLKCPECHNDLSFLLENDDTLSSFIKYGHQLRKDKEYKNLKTIADLMMVKYPSCFYSYCFASIGLLEFDFISEMPSYFYILNKNEIEDDIKSRLYHLSRVKYISIPDYSFDLLSSHYPDIAGEKRGVWLKSKTAYEEKRKEVNQINSYIDSFCGEYFKRMEQFAKDDDEKQIVINFNKYLEFIHFATSELDRYEEDANAFAQSDFNRTPKPGNKPKFFIYLSLFIMCVLLFVISTFNNVFALVNGLENPNINNSPVTLISSILTTVLIVVMTIFISVKGKLFSKSKILLGISFIAFTFVLSFAGIYSSSTSNLFAEVWYSFVGLAISIAVGILSMIRLIKLKPNNTYVGTYIGNFDALIKNNFFTTYTFTWHHFNFDGYKLLENIH